MRPFISMLFLGLIITLAGSAAADSIVVNGVEHENVYVRSSATMYYVQEPDSGDVWSVRKADVVPENVTLTPDDGKRDLILAKWNAARMLRQSDSAESSVPTTVAEEESATPLLTNLGSDGEPGTPELVTAPRVTWQRPAARRAPQFEMPETRVYQFAPMTQTLPKIVAQAPGGGLGAGGVGAGGGIGANAGAGGLGGGAGGFGGGVGGPGGAGGAGGFGGGAGFGGAHFSNISQLFTTIDDRLVGETPNPIVMMWGQR